MIQSKANDPRGLKEAKLRRRDWILLPMISLLTICCISVSTELIARSMFPAEGAVGETCMIVNDPSIGSQGIPNCVCWEKVPEGELTEYRFNSSGYRNDVEFGPKPPGTYRIVMLGTSIAAGIRVPLGKTFAALLPLELSRQTGRTVDLYNEGMPWRSPHFIALHFNDVLAAKPDMILWILGPLDIERALWRTYVEQDAKSLSLWGRIRLRATASFPKNSFTDSIGEIIKQRRTPFLLRHFLFESQSQYIKSSLIQADYQKDFLRSEPSAEWQQRLEEFDRSAADLEGHARAADIPLVAVLIPDRAQAAMISMGEWPAGYDPYKLNEEVRSIITSHGGTYIDILPGFRPIPNPEKYYFPVDGHLDADGHRIVSGLLAKGLMSGAVPALNVAAQTRAAHEQGR
jgi:hypothetical protein